MTLLSRASYIALGVAAVIFLSTFLILWLPFYVAGSGFTLFLYPLLVFVLPIIWVACTGAITWAAFALASPRAGRRARDGSLVAVILIASVIAVGAVPAYWFGSAFAALWGGDVNFSS